MICDRNDNGICKSPWCYHKSAGGTCLNPRFKFNPTNADRIRSMSDEELARALHQAYADGMCDMVRAQRDIGTHVNTIMYYRNWLQQPAKE